MTQQKILDLFTTLAPRISRAGYEQLQELHEFSGVGVMPNTPLIGCLFIRNMIHGENGVCYMPNGQDIKL
jgi:hypothetical protein